jgi:hypothetical protein
VRAGGLPLDRMTSAVLCRGSLASGPSQRHSLPAHQHPQAGPPGADRRGALRPQWPEQALPADGRQTIHRAGSGSG